MTELQEHIDFFDQLSEDENGRPFGGHLGAVIDAARRVANLDIDAFHKALYEWYHSERPMSPEVEMELINAALGTTEDDEDLPTADEVFGILKEPEDNDAD